jgi:ABC-type antimicrobial peptide transport system permease subunit
LGRNRIGFDVSSGGRLAIAGCIIGLLGAAAASRVVNSLLIVLTRAAVAIFLLALAASAIPAIRAASIDPLRALRTE